MKTFYRFSPSALFCKIVLTALIGSAAATSAQAESFIFRYSFTDGTLLTGAFEGTAVGNLVTKLSHISAAVDGVNFHNSGHLFNASFDFSGGVALWGAVASFDGKQNNFIFSDADPRWDVGERFETLSDDSGESRADTCGLWMPYVRPYYAEVFDPTKWQLISAVPEPESYAMLLAGLGLISPLARRRKQNAKTS